MASASGMVGLVVRLAALLVLACGAAAVESGDLYQARTIVTGQGEESRGPGIVQCLEDVLIKVSGDPRLGGDPGVAALAGEAGEFVREFRYRDRMAGIPVHDEQGTRDRPYDLTVSFHPDKIDAALRSLGRAPWTERPRIVMVLGVRNGAMSYALAADGDRGRDMREALDRAARRVGMAVALPDRAALDAASLSVETLPAADLPSLDATAKAIGGEVALAGSMVWSDEALGWIADWRLTSGGKTYRWQVGGVSFDAAFRSAMSGAAQVLSGHGEPE